MGITAVLHTWSQTLLDHYHLHCIVTGGGLARGRHALGAGPPHYLFPVRALSAVFRGKFCAGPAAALCGRASWSSTASWPPDGPAHAFQRLLRQATRRSWVVYAKRPFAGPEQVLAYLSRYTHRVAISPRRLLALDRQAHTVTFAYKDYADGARRKTMTLGVGGVRAPLLPASACRSALSKSATTACWATPAPGQRRPGPAPCCRPRRPPDAVPELTPPQPDAGSRSGPAPGLSLLRQPALAPRSRSCFRLPPRRKSAAALGFLMNRFAAPLSRPRSRRPRHGPECGAHSTLCTGHGRPGSPAPTRRPQSAAVLAWPVAPSVPAKLIQPAPSSLSPALGTSRAPLTFPYNPGLGGLSGSVQRQCIRHAGLDGLGNFGACCGPARRIHCFRLEGCRMQIAGNSCKVCEGNIVLSSEGKFCARCGTFVHLACAPEPKCGVCGEPFQHHERPKADPLSEAILPRALLPSKGVGLILFLIVGLVLLVVVWYWCLMHGLVYMRDSM